MFAAIGVMKAQESYVQVQVRILLLANNFIW